MKCADYQELLYLKENSELTPEESELLLKHLQECPVCRNESAHRETHRQFADLLRKSSIEDQKRAGTIEKILASIETGSDEQMHIIPAKKNRLQYSLISRILNIASIVLLGIFLLQQMDMRRKVSAMERELLERKERGIPGIESVNASRNFRNLIEGSDPGEDVIMELRKQYNEIHELQQENTALLIFIRQQYPEIYREFLEKNALLNNSDTDL